mmetsp:Transcript_30666/g.30305  ORF Transcript_30666/g.30305 Transcript_30666/m.30305 type:complete len:609 (-) Transcript_30666:29-1855(-)
MSGLTRTAKKQYESTVTASIERLDQYIEDLYSDNPDDKIQASRQLLYLFNEAENIEIIVSHESLPGILGRTLRDEYKTSMELSLYLSGVFYIISNYSQLHQIVLQNQIGDTCMKIIEYHIQRHELRRSEIQNLKKDAEYEKKLKNMEILEKKQNKLLWLCFSILLNLSEDIQIERKMKKRKIVGLLVKMLERDNLTLLEVVFTFLKKLSVFAENKNEMYQDENIVQKLQKFVPAPHHQEICSLVLRLIHNLSFDKSIREQFDSLGFIPRIVTLLKHAPFRGITLRILYQLSLDEKSKSTFTYTECIPIVFMLMIQFPEAKVGRELMGLAINLCSNSRNAEVFADGNQLEALVKRALEYHDDLIMKMIRNIARAAKTQHVQEVLEKYAKKFISIICGNEDMDFVVEVLGTMVNMDLEEEWAKYLSSPQLLDFLQKHLVVGYAEDDVVLESIMLVGTITSCEQIAKMIANTLIIQLLHTLLSEKQEDDEMVMQIMYTFYRLLLFKATRTIILNKTQAVNFLLELLQDKNPRIRKMADTVLSLVQEYDEDWREEIKLKRFQLHNQEWLSLIENVGDSDYDEDEISDEDSDRMHWADLSDLDGHEWGNISED